MKKIYESKKAYSKKYNKTHKSVRINESLYNRIKKHVENKNLSVKGFLENLIENSLEKIEN